MADQPENTNPWSKLVMAAWADEKLKRRLVNTPADVFREYGIPLPPGGAELKVVEDTQQVSHFVLPRKPAADLAELSPEQLEAVAGGATTVATTTTYTTSKRSTIRVPGKLEFPN